MENYNEEMRQVVGIVVEDNSRRINDAVKRKTPCKGKDRRQIIDHLVSCRYSEILYRQIMQLYNETST